MGHHDPLDGLVTYLQLQAAEAKTFGGPKSSTSAMRSQTWPFCAKGKTGEPTTPRHRRASEHRIQTGPLVLIEGLEQADLLDDLLDSSLASLRSDANREFLKFPAQYRLAFRSWDCPLDCTHLRSYPH